LSECVLGSKKLVAVQVSLSPRGFFSLEYR
jgi:hypothetical protein